MLEISKKSIISNFLYFYLYRYLKFWSNDESISYRYYLMMILIWFEEKSYLKFFLEALEQQVKYLQFQYKYWILFKRKRKLAKLYFLWILKEDILRKMPLSSMIFLKPQKKLKSQRKGWKTQLQKIRNSMSFFA